MGCCKGEPVCAFCVSQSGLKQLLRKSSGYGYGFCDIFYNFAG